MNKEDYKRIVDFILLMGHEIKQPLTPIIGYADIIKEQTIDDEKIAHLDKIIGGGNQMLNMITQMINLIRIETKRLMFNFKKVKLEELLKDCLLKNESTINLHQIKIKKKVVDTEFKGDNKLLIIAITNLIHLAIILSSDKSIIELEALKKKGTTIISIKNMGPRLSKNTVACLLQPFCKKNLERGHGLGLAFTNKVILEHKGQLKIKNHAKGNLFVIELPQ